MNDQTKPDSWHVARLEMFEAAVVGKLDGTRNQGRMPAGAYRARLKYELGRIRHWLATYGVTRPELEPCLMCGDPTSNGLLCETCEAGQHEEARR